MLQSAIPLADVREQMAACIKCAACMPACPTYRIEHRESMGPRGRLALAVGLLEGTLTAAEGATLPISSCIDCRACVPACPRHIRLDDVFYAAKAELAAQRSGGFTSWVIRKAARVIVTGNRFHRVLAAGRLLTGIYRGIADTSPVARLLPFFRNGRKRVLPDIVVRPMTDDYAEVVEPVLAPGQSPVARVAFFPGCVINFTQTTIGHATVRALTRLGVTVVIPKQAPCCGIPLLSIGDRAGARQVAEEVIQRYGSLDADWIITACASCGTTLRETYPDLMRGAAPARALAEKVLDVSEFIHRHTDFAERAGRITQPVTYHDPCHLVRGMGVTREPREILRQVSDGLMEMDGADRCCGFGGLFSALHYDLSLEVGAEKARAVAATGAPIVATGCPGCQMQMTDTLTRGGVPVRVLHTIEVLDMALKKPAG